MHQHLVSSGNGPVRIAQSAAAFYPEFTPVVVFDLSHGEFPLIVIVVSETYGELLQASLPAAPPPNLCRTPPSQWLERQSPVAMDRAIHKEKFGAGKEARTLDLYLGKVSLYQLSYSRM